MHDAYISHSSGVLFAHVHKCVSLTKMLNITNLRVLYDGVVEGVRDLSLRVDPAERFSLRFGVNNLFDKTPPVVSGVLGQTNASTYDVLGRTYYLAATARF